MQETFCSGRVIESLSDRVPCDAGSCLQGLCDLCDAGSCFAGIV